MLTCCKFDHLESISMKFVLKYKTFIHENTFQNVVCEIVTILWSVYSIKCASVSGIKRAVFSRKQASPKNSLNHFLFPTEFGFHIVVLRILGNECDTSENICGDKFTLLFSFKNTNGTICCVFLSVPLFRYTRFKSIRSEFDMFQNATPSSRCPKFLLKCTSIWHCEESGWIYP